MSRCISCSCQLHVIFYLYIYVMTGDEIKAANAHKLNNTMPGVASIHKLACPSRTSCSAILSIVTVQAVSSCSARTLRVYGVWSWIARIMTHKRQVSYHHVYSICCLSPSLVSVPSPRTCLNNALIKACSTALLLPA